MSKNEKEKEFEFLDEECKDLTFYKILRPVLDKENTYININYRSVTFEYELWTWYTEEDAPLDRSTSGKGFYCYESIGEALKSYTYSMKEVVSGKVTIHEVEVKEIIAHKNKVIRARQVMVTDPLTVEELIENMVEWDESAEEIIEKYDHHASELERYQSIKNLLEAQRSLEKAISELEAHKKQIEGYWKKYNRYRPFFSRFPHAITVFDFFKLPHDLTKQCQHPFESFYDDSRFNEVEEELDVILAYFKNLINRQVRSIPSFIGRMKKKVQEITDYATEQLEHTKGVMETHEKLLKDIPEFSFAQIKNSYVRGDLKRSERKRYDFQVSFLSGGDNFDSVVHESD